MQTLLPAIRDVLQNLTQLPRKGDCYITPHVGYMPTGTIQPCLGIKDAGVTREELAGGMVELTMKVDLAGFVKMAIDGGEVICGEKGLYQLLDAAIGLLGDGDLGLAGFQGMWIGPDRPSELFKTGNNQWLVRLVRTVIFTMERSGY